METSAVQYTSQSDYLEIPSWVNRPYERRKAQERERLLQEARKQNAQGMHRAQKITQQRNYQGKRLERQPYVDTYTKTHARGKRAKKSSMPAILTSISGLGAAAALVLSLATAKAPNSEVQTETYIPNGIVQLSEKEQYPFENDEIYADSFNGTPVSNISQISQSTQTTNSYEDVIEQEEQTPYETETPAIETSSSEYHPLIEEEYIGSGASFLEELDQLSGIAVDNYYMLCDVLNMTEEETADYLTQLCESEDWANGVTYPSLFLAQISRESKYDPNAVGDGGLAIGLGQFHTCAVDEVNNRFHTNYTYQDRKDPFKALEMMSLLLRYDYSQTKSTYGMLAMYNQGHPALDTEAGQNYVKNVLAEIGLPMA